jgi:hypothetical protein
VLEENTTCSEILSVDAADGTLDTNRYGADLGRRLCIAILQLMSFFSLETS